VASDREVFVRKRSPPRFGAEVEMRNAGAIKKAGAIFRSGLLNRLDCFYWSAGWIDGIPLLSIPITLVGETT
jgi:hypothetical protein